jgi:hypothetical protein
MGIARRGGVTDSDREPLNRAQKTKAADGAILPGACRSPQLVASRVLAALLPRHAAEGAEVVWLADGM